MPHNRTEFHRQETPEGVLTWSINVRLTPTSMIAYGLPTNFELDGEPLTVAAGRAMRRRYATLE